MAALTAAAVINAMAADPPATAKEPRFPQLTVAQLNEQQKPLGEQIMKVSSVGLGGPYTGGRGVVLQARQNSGNIVAAYGVPGLSHGPTRRFNRLASPTPS
jgi:hypothetical protein